MEPSVMLVLAVAGLIAAYMAWNIGANDVANAMGTSVGSGALTLKRAIVVAAVFEFAGAVFFGSHVTDTIRKGVLDFGGNDLGYELSQDLMYGFMGALLAASIWLTIATKYGLPVSTTHSIVGGVIGMGLYIQADSVNWGKVMEIVMSWIVSPLLGGIIAYLSFTLIKRVIMNHEDPVERTRAIAPLLALPTFFILGLGLSSLGCKADKTPDPDDSFACVPDDNGPFTAALYNHGGLGDAVGGDLDGTCEALADAGSMLGSAGVVVLNDTVNIVDVARSQTDFFEAESCGQCAPCRIGTQLLNRALARYQEDGDPGALTDVEDIAWEMEEGSICGLGIAAPLPLTSAMKHFPEAFRSRGDA